LYGIVQKTELHTRTHSTPPLPTHTQYAKMEEKEAPFEEEPNIYRGLRHLKIQSDFDVSLYNIFNK